MESSYFGGSDRVTRVTPETIERAWTAVMSQSSRSTLRPTLPTQEAEKGFKRMVLGFRAAFPDLAMEVHECFGAGDRVVTRFTMSGTHEGDFMGLESTGEWVEFDGIAIYVMNGDKRVDGWAQLDRLDLSIQLGAIDRPGSSPKYK